MWDMKINTYHYLEGVEVCEPMIEVEAKDNKRVEEVGRVCDTTQRYPHVPAQEVIDPTWEWQKAKNTDSRYHIIDL